MSNVIIIHGGGLVDCSAYVLMRYAEKFAEAFEKVFIGRFSFESLYTKDFWMEYNKDLKKELEGKRGTYFGTCRDIFLEGEKREKALSLLKKEKISHVVVCGGDGSARQVYEMYQDFEKVGIHIIFPMPLTVDGINGGKSIGIDQAVRECIRQIENMVATSLQTRNEEKFGVLCAELQGRNRDDITAKVVEYFYTKCEIADCSIEDMLLIVIPATMETNFEKLIERINNSDKRTLILISEGASIKISDIKDNTSRKVRTLVVGHQAQSNNQTNNLDKEYIDHWIDCSNMLIRTHLDSSFCIAKVDDLYCVEDIGYYAILNPREQQKVDLPKKMKELVKWYTIS